MRLDLFHKQISVTVIVFGKNGSDYREKNYISMENYSVPITDSISVHCLWGFVINL